MKIRICTVFLAAAMLLGAGNSYAQDSSNLKIAVLDMGAALLNSEVAKGVEQ